MSWQPQRATETCGTGVAHAPVCLIYGLRDSLIVVDCSLIIVMSSWGPKSVSQFHRVRVSSASVSLYAGFLPRSGERGNLVMI